MGEFGALGVALALAAALALGLFLVSYLLVPRSGDGERLTAYECGFDPFGDSRSPFDVRFYLVAILFIVFDLEVSFLFPWSVAAAATGLWAYGAVVAFLGVLTVGFLYEWVRGALDWLWTGPLFCCWPGLPPGPPGGRPPPTGTASWWRPSRWSGCCRCCAPYGTVGAASAPLRTSGVPTGRLQLQYLLLSYDRNLRLRLRLDLAPGRPCPSAGSLFPAARWLEREVWDLFGIPFSGHGDLRRLLTDYGFEGHPLRKEFPLVGFSEVRYDDLAKRVVLVPVELPQEYRHFDFMLPWKP